MRTRLSTCLLAACVCVLATEAAAQVADSSVVRRTALEGGPSVTAGSRVRVWVKTPRDMVWQGILQAWPADTLRIARPLEPARVEIPLASVDLLQVSIGQKRSTVPGLLIGGMIGTLAGVFIGSSIDSGEDSNFSVGALLAGPAVGLALGGIVGHKVKVERWREVPLSP